ncbi:AMP nucleosidase, partial [Salmonella enterica]|nr:AMP nucleosidase [Salmonella enterica]
MENKGTNLTPEQALDRLEELYEQSVNALREAIADYVDNGTLPDPHARLNGLFVYPSLSVSWDGATPNPPKTRAFGRFTHPGCYTTTVTRPALFRAYLLEQLNLVYHDYGAHIAVEASH